jgi:hypothetical protein
MPNSRALPEPPLGASAENLLSNRERFYIPSEDSGCGVDKISISFEVADFDVRPDSWASYACRGGGETYSMNVELLEDFGFFLSVWRAGVGGPPFGKIEFNPSRFRDPHGVSVGSVEDCLDVISVALLMMSERVTLLYPGELSKLRIKRLDVTKDFHSVIPVAVVIRAVGSMPRKYTRRTQIFSDPKSGGAQTLVDGNNAGTFRLYDKAAESGGKAVEGTLRFEIQGRGPWLKRGGLTTLSELANRGVESFGRERFDWSQCGVEVQSDNGWYQALKASGLSEREQVFFIGWCFSNRFGPTNLGSATEAKYRKVQRDLQVTFGSDFDETVKVFSRLDWDSGQVLTRVA